MLHIDAVDIQLLFVVIFYVLCCPYTKVEESFSMQAIFDLSTFGGHTQFYDHLEFPGVVPRSFIGPLIVALLSYPFNALATTYSVPVVYNQIICRSVLGALVWVSFVHFRNGVEGRFGRRASQLTGLLTSFQFHICFYMSRTLPNTFALALSLNAFGLWLKVRVVGGRDVGT
jgi:alpha-1,6-mannosyltransferase